MDVFGVPSGLLLVYGVLRNSIPLVTCQYTVMYIDYSLHGIQSFMFALLN